MWRVKAQIVEYKLEEDSAIHLILYWGGYEYTWKIAVALVIGLIIFGIGTQVARTDVMPMLRPAAWIGPWILGSVIIGALGRYGAGSHSWLPEWIDLLVNRVGTSCEYYRLSIDTCFELVGLIRRYH